MKSNGLRKDGSLIESAIDHIYTNEGSEKNVSVRKLPISATDHLPIIAEIINSHPKKIEKKENYQKKHEKLHPVKLDSKFG